MSRISGRLNDELRKISIIPNVNRYAEGSCVVNFGNTQVLCTATIDDSVPGFMRNTGKGWITAEYGMLPRSTHNRMKRESAQGKQTGRTQEIQRLIGRSLRCIVDLETFGERQIILDCDVIQADGGTRTASITGSYVALQLAFRNMINRGVLSKIPMYTEVAAVSCGILKGQPLLDLDYEEDSAAEVDANFILNGNGHLIEVQATGEENTYSKEEFLEMLDLAQGGIEQIIEIQRKALKNG